MHFSRRYILLLVLILGLVVLFLPIKVNYSFEATSLVSPAREWHFKRGQDDSFITEFHDYSCSSIGEIKSFKFERGDVTDIQIKNDMNSGNRVNKGDTIAFIHSHHIENELIRLRNLKLIEQAALKLSLSGEKQSLVKQALEKIEFAKERLDLEERNLKRQETLFEEEVISEVNIESAKNQHKLAQINLEIVKNEYLSLATGQKDEAIKFIQQKIEAYGQEIEALNQLRNSYHIIAPLDGIVRYDQDVSTLISIEDTTKYILRIPVKVRNIQYLNEISAIRFSVPGYMEPYEASFLNLDKNVNFMSNQQMVIAKAEINESLNMIVPGMAVKCRVICDEVTLLRFIKRELKLRL